MNAKPYKPRRLLRYLAALLTLAALALAVAALLGCRGGPNRAPEGYLFPKPFNPDVNPSQKWPR